MRRSVLLLAVICIVISSLGCATAALSPREQELARTYYNLGNTYERLGEYQSAVSAYKRALEIDPLFHEASYNLAVVLCLRESYAESQRQFRSLLTYDPDNTKVLSALAWCFKKDRQAPQALEVYRQIAEIDPGDVTSRTHMIYLLLDLEHFEQASDALMDLIEFAGPDVELLYLLYTAEEAREEGSGMQWLEAAWQRDPADERTAAALLGYAVEQGREEQARTIASSLLDVPPDWEQMESYGDELVLELLRYVAEYGEQEDAAFLFAQATASQRFSYEDLALHIPKDMLEALGFADEDEDAQDD